jgi:hypothetical protein
MMMKNLINGERRRWVALAVVCMGQLMMVLDSTATVETPRPF